MAEKKKESKAETGEMIAKKDHVIVQNEYRREIKTGEDVSDVPAKFHENLRTEGVL